MNRRITALTITAVALFGLTACTGTTAPESSGGSNGGTSQGDGGGTAEESGQTVAEACSVVTDTIDAAFADFQDVGTEDLGATAEAMTAAAEDISAVIGDVTNPEVAAVVPGLQEAFEKIGAAVQASAEGDTSALAELEGAGTQLQEDMTTFQELCITQ